MSPRTDEAKNVFPAGETAFMVRLAHLSDEPDTVTAVWAVAPADMA